MTVNRETDKHNSKDSDRHIPDWNCFYEEQKPDPITVLMEMQRILTAHAEEMGCITVEDIEEIVEEDKANTGDDFYCNVIDWISSEWSETILEARSFLREVYEFKDYLTSYSKTRDALPIIIEALAALHLFCDRGEDFLEEFSHTFETDKYDEHTRYEVATSEATAFATYVENAGIRFKLDEAAYKLKAYCLLRSEDPVRLDQIMTNLRDREIESLLSKDVVNAILKAIGTERLKRIQIVKYTSYEDGGHMGSSLTKLKRAGILKHARPYYWINPDFYGRLGICPDKDGQ